MTFFGRPMFLVSLREARSILRGSASPRRAGLFAVRDSRERRGGRPTVGAIALLTLTVTFAASPLAAQWIRYPTAGLPRQADGSVDLSAPTPRTADGKPDFSGLWTSDEVDPRRPNVPPNPHDATTSRRMINLGVELPGGLPYQPWLAELTKERWAANAKMDPHVRCMPLNFLRAYGMPHLLKFVQTPGLLLMLNEWNAGYRQVFTDGRPLPEDPNPSWQGYSSATWSGDTLVVDTIGFRDDLWIDWDGSMITGAARVRERIRRPDFGHLEIEVTVDDPKAYTKPWSVTLRQQFAADTELIDEICAEGENSSRNSSKDRRLGGRPREGYGPTPGVIRSSDAVSVSSGPAGKSCPDWRRRGHHPGPPSHL